MSDHTTSFIPLDPRYVPTTLAQALAADTLRKFAPHAAANESATPLAFPRKEVNAHESKAR